MRNNYTIAVVIPCYKVSQQIRTVVGTLPDFIDSIILVNDASPDDTAKILSTIEDKRCKILSHTKNKGVGGAMITGFNEALHQKCDIIVKIDGDGQMDVSYIAHLVDKMSEHVDFVKGNRLFDRKMLKNMPTIRRLGNVGLSFMMKCASGYWNVSDPVNGFFAIKASILQKMDLSKISPRFFFESSLLIELYYVGARIKEVSMPAIYADEKSNLSIVKSLFSFPPKLCKAWIRRIIMQYFIYDFNICSLYILFGIPSFFFGLIYGIITWIHYSSIAVPTPTGTIMVALLTFVLGFQMLLAAIQYDCTAVSPFLTE